MSEEKQEKPAMVRLVPVQFKDLLVAMAHIVEERKKINFPIYSLLLINFIYY